MNGMENIKKERTPYEIKSLQELEKRRSNKVDTLTKKIDKSTNRDEINRLQDELDTAYNHLDSVRCMLYDKEPTRIPTDRSNKTVKKKYIFSSISSFFY